MPAAKKTPTKPQASKQKAKAAPQVAAKAVAKAAPDAIPAKKAAAPVAKATSVPLVQPGMPNLAPNLEVSSYRGAVAVKSFLGWLVLVVLGVLVGGMLAAHLLVSQRLGQLVDETSARVELQGQSRAAVVAEWVNGLNRLTDGTANAELLRLYMADASGLRPMDNPLLALSVRARAPYIQQLVDDMTRRHGFQGAQLLKPTGEVVFTSGQLPQNLSSNLPDLTEVVRQARGTVLPVRMATQPDGAGLPVMDMLKPIMALEGNVPGSPAVLGVLWVTVPVGPHLATLVGATPLDREGERAALVQQAEGKAEVIGRTALAQLPIGLDTLQRNADGARVVMASVIDGEPVFASVMPVAGTPLGLLQEYKAKQALAAMDLFKPGLYAVVALLTAALGAMMLALTLHLMAQRNTTRVKLLGQTMEALVRVVEARDSHLAGHHAKVARLALKLANVLHLSVGERATLFYAAQLSSVGRLLVPRDILAKKGAYSDKDRTELQAHMTQAVQILGDLDFDLPIVPVIGQLYERVDGSGYPLGLRGHQMHRMAKVLSAADAFTAMTADRAHRKALSRSEAMGIMENGAFDADVMKALKAVTR